jgi:hypothetical protein
LTQKKVDSASLAQYFGRIYQLQGVDMLSLVNLVAESFLVFSQEIPSQDLGFFDSKASTLELTVGRRDLTVHQSPTILSSNREGGTTGAGKVRQGNIIQSDH